MLFMLQAYNLQCYVLLNPHMGKAQIKFSVSW